MNPAPKPRPASVPRHLAFRGRWIGREDGLDWASRGIFSKKPSNFSRINPQSRPPLIFFFQKNHRTLPKFGLSPPSRPPLPLSLSPSLLMRRRVRPTLRAAAARLPPPPKPVLLAASSQPPSPTPRHLERRRPGPLRRPRLHAASSRPPAVPRSAPSTATPPRSPLPSPPPRSVLASTHAVPRLRSPARCCCHRRRS